MINCWFLLLSFFVSVNVVVSFWRCKGNTVFCPVPNFRPTFVWSVSDTPSVFGQSQEMPPVSVRNQGQNVKYRGFYGCSAKCLWMAQCHWNPTGESSDYHAHARRIVKAENIPHSSHFPHPAIHREKWEVKGVRPWRFHERPWRFSVRPWIFHERP